MTGATWARCGILVVALAGLSACVDVSADVEILGTDSARGTLRMEADKEFYRTSMAADEPCADAVVTETDTHVVCTEIIEGSFADLSEEDDGPSMAFEPIGEKGVRVAFPTASLRDEMAGGAPEDDETLAMAEAMLEGHFMTLRIHGRIASSNMEISADGRTASLAIPFFELMTGVAALPDEAWAIVKFE